jgi:hypothetical protein
MIVALLSTFLVMSLLLLLAPSLVFIATFPLILLRALYLFLYPKYRKDKD